jgi:hypothetical protein
MKRPSLTLFILVFTTALASSANAAIVLRNGNFDTDPDLGGNYDEINAPTSWYTGSTVPQSWNDFRFGNDGNGAWINNAIALGQDYLGPNFDPQPETGYFYTSLGIYNGETGAMLSGLGYNRVNGNFAGSFEVGFYYSSFADFVGADGSDVGSAASATLLSRTTVDISSITGTQAKNQAFSASATFAGSGIRVGDEIWLRIGDGPDDGNLNTFDEPMIDNLTLTVVPEPSTITLALLAGGGAILIGVLRRRRS